MLKHTGEKCGKLVWRTDRQTDGQTDGQTECKPIVPSGFTGGGLKSILIVLLKQYKSPTDPNKFKSTSIMSLHFLRKSSWKLLLQLSVFLFNYMESNFEQNAHVNVNQPWRKLNFICNSSYGSLLPTFIQICESIAEKSPENVFWTKGNNSCKSGSNVTKVKLDL